MALNLCAATLVRGGREGSCLRAVFGTSPELLVEPHEVPERLAVALEREYA